MSRTAFIHSYDKGENINIWSLPDMSVLSAGRRNPPLMPPEMFGPVWPLLSEMAEGAGSPVDYLAISFLSVAASLIGGKRKVKPYAIADWSEPCILWAGLVGDPSSNKSPALDRTTNALRDMEKEHALEHGDKLKGWKADCERAKVEWGSFQGLVKEAAKEGLSTPPLPDDAVEPYSLSAAGCWCRTPRPRSWPRSCLAILQARFTFGTNLPGG